MSANQAGNQGSGNAQHADASTTIGVGGPTSGEAGSTPTHETQAETGGSGGSGLTRNEDAGSRQSDDAAASATGQQRAGGQARRAGGDSAADAHMRGFQDTHSEQAGGSGTGLGSPETGANQDVEDLDRQLGARRDE